MVKRSEDINNREVVIGNRDFSFTKQLKPSLSRIQKLKVGSFSDEIVLNYCYKF